MTPAASLLSRAFDHELVEITDKVYMLSMYCIGKSGEPTETIKFPIHQFEIDQSGVKNINYVKGGCYGRQS
jgi:hypothetical protein